jgi:AcrR family transcriptional regulator
MSPAFQPDDMAERRGGGRPADHEARDVRGRLLMAARDLFTQHGFGGTSIRQIAADARATPAMIHYYFGDKHGLYRALIEEIIHPVLEGLEERAGAGEGSPGIDDFMTAYVGMFGRHPWLPVLVFREMYEGGEQFRQHFARRFGSRLRRLLGDALAAERRAGRLRADTDPDLAIVSILSLCIFPFLARPMLERVLDQTVDQSFVDRWVDHAGKLLAGGLGP